MSEQDDLTPAERRVVALVGPLRDAEPKDRGLVRRVVHAARRQRTARRVVLAASSVLAPVIEILGGLTGLRRRRPR